MSLLMAFGFAIVSEALAPYASGWDTWIYRIGHAVVCVGMYYALLLKVGVSDERASGRKLFGTLLVVAHAFFLVVVVVETFVLACESYLSGRARPKKGQVAPGEEPLTVDTFAKQPPPDAKAKEMETGEFSWRVANPCFKNPSYR